jgi:hypothetical protein
VTDAVEQIGTSPHFRQATNGRTPAIGGSPRGTVVDAVARRVPDGDPNYSINVPWHWAGPAARVSNTLWAM